MGDQTFSKDMFYEISSAQTGLRAPQSTSQCLQATGVKPRVLEASASVEATRGAGRVRGSPKKAAVPQKYIPGLNSPQAAPPEKPIQARNTPTKSVPPELLENFQSGSKHPVSALTEYCALTRLTASFQEVAVQNYSLIARFACVCKINGEPYPQGTGKTKKEAKTNAAKIAFTMLLGLEDDDVLGDSNVEYDSMGRKIIIKKTTVSEVSELPDDAIYADEDLELAASALSKNPVSMLQEYCAKKKLPLTITVSDVPGPKGYVARVLIDDEEYSVACSQNKKDAKRAAADDAMMLLLASEEPHFDGPALNAVDKMASMSLHKLYELLSRNPEYLAGQKVVAAFIVKRGNTDPGEVVAMGTGNVCVSGQCLSIDGRVINDCHAEVIAKRGLVKYLYKEVKTSFEGNLVHSLFEEQLGSLLLKLKRHISIHLYISTAPCGDGATFTSSKPGTPVDSADDVITKEPNQKHYPTFDTDNQGLLRTKIENGEGTIPLEDLTNPVVLTMDGIRRGERLRTMSCSDKILRWNVLGLQGSLLGHFVSPVYISTLIIGTLFDHGHLTRAVCCRVNDKISDELPPGYRLHHPAIFKVCIPQLSRGTAKMCRTSMNWSYGDDHLEFVDGCSGKETDSSPFKSGPALASRLSKASFLFRFRDLAKVGKRIKLMQVRNYAEAKKANTVFQQAKSTFYEHMGSSGFGYWVQKPIEQSYFNR